jgi:hypothetical protein
MFPRVHTPGLATSSSSSRARERYAVPDKAPATFDGSYRAPDMRSYETGERRKSSHGDYCGFGYGFRDGAHARWQIKQAKKKRNFECKNANFAFFDSFLLAQVKRKEYFSLAMKFLGCAKGSECLLRHIRRKLYLVATTFSF